MKLNIKRNDEMYSDERSSVLSIDIGGSKLMLGIVDMRGNTVDLCTHGGCFKGSTLGKDNRRRR